MRDIKFRFWNTNVEIMMPDSEGWNEDLGINEMFEGMEHLDIIPMQYTGVKDKNGKEIYDGDILKSAGIVAWNDVEHKWSCIDIEWNNNREWHDMLYLTTPLEVKGNIYENPELCSLKKTV